MSTTKNFLAFDLGASSGRAVVGHFDGTKLWLEEAHRFNNGPVTLLDSLHWNVLGLFSEMKLGLSKAISMGIGEIAAMGIDTWGVDFALLDKQGQLINNPYHYRDSRTDGMVEKAFELVPRAEIFAQTGIQFIQLNSLFQLLAMVQQKSPVLNIAHSLLFMPDLFNYWFTGQKTNEYTIATTSQAYNTQENRWATSLLEKLNIPTNIFLDVVPPGANLGPVLPHISTEVGLKNNVPVIAPGCHDTASAVAAVPVSNTNQNNFAYLSSGTWSLLGVEIPSPIITPKSLEYNFTNEGGVQNTIRLLKNLGGLWIIQESRRIWAQQGKEYSFADLTAMANSAPSLTAFIDPDASIFLPLGDMPTRISEFCRQTGQTPPADKGTVIRIALESLALKYRWVLEKVEELTNRRIEVVHIVGGGTQNDLLNQFAANATGRQVITGPIEATAIGNILMQMLALGEITSLNEGRVIVQNSFPVNSYLPQNQADWDEAYHRFLKILTI